MSIFKKIRKGIKKVAKGIGKRIKKVVNKVGRAFGKLGIVGQLGMMFLMPYAMAGLSSLWGATAGKAFGQFAANQAGTFASNLVAKGGIKGAIGQAMGAIHSAGSAIGTAYNSISTAISNGFDRAGNFLKGRGFVVTDPTTVLDPSSIIPKDPSAIAVDKGTGVALDTGKALGLDATTTAPLSKDTIASIASGKDALTEQFTDVVGIDPVDVVVDKDKSLLQRGTEFVSKSWEEFKGDLTDPKQYGKKGAQTAFAHLQTALAPDMPVQTINHVRPLDIGTIDAFRNDGIFNTTDFTRINNAYQEEGSAWGGMNQLGQSYLMEQASMGDTNYINDMRRLQGYGGGS